MVLDHSKFDAVLFHERNIKTRDLPTEAERSPEQIYIHYNLEPPICHLTNEDLSGWLLSLHTGRWP